MTNTALNFTSPFKATVNYGGDLLTGWFIPGVTVGRFPVMVRRDGRGWSLPEDTERLASAFLSKRDPFISVTGWHVSSEEFKTALERHLATAVFVPGTRVSVPKGSRLSPVRPGSTGKVLDDATREGRRVVLFDAGSFSHGLGVEHPVQQVIPTTDLEIIPTPAAPKVPTAPMTKAVLETLQRKGSISPLEAGGVLKCRDLPKRISELRKLGWPIQRELKNDPRDGQRYARYSLEKAA